MAYGYGVERDKSWPCLLGERLPGRSVISLGMPGAVPQQYFRYFDRFGVRLRPRVLIFGIFTGYDLVDAENFDRWVAAGSPDNDDARRFFEGEVPKRQGILTKSHLVMFLSALRKNLGLQLSATTLELADGEKLQLARNDPMHPGFKSVVEATRAARNLAVDSGSEFMVLLFATMEATYLPLHGVPFPSLSHPSQEVLASKGIRCIDPGIRFRELAARSQKMFYETDGHPSEPGDRVIADVVADRLGRDFQD
jgi:hypothetical protein